MAVSKGLQQDIKSQNNSASLLKGFLRTGRESIELVKGLLYLSPCIGMPFLEEEQPGSGLLFLRNTFPQCPVEAWHRCRAREEWAKSLGHWRFFHPGIESRALFPLPRRTGCTHTFTSCPLLASLAGPGVSHNPPGSVLLSLYLEFFQAQYFVTIFCHV